MVNRIYKRIFIAVFCLFVFSGLQAQGKDRVKELQAKLDSLIAGIKCDVSAQVVSATKYDQLYEYKSTKKMIPASISKVITSATALSKLGISFEFRTMVYTDDNNISDGIVNGNLYLKGYGDPDFGGPDMDVLVSQILLKNIKEITGNIIYDESYFDDEHYALSNYYQGDTGPAYWPYISALSFNKNKGSGNPAAYAANTLSADLIGKNIKLDGIVVAGVTPNLAKEVAKFSRSIYDVISFMNKTSDNHSAITVFKVTGAEFKSPPGTLDKGSSAVIDFMSSVGVDRNTYEILEGSGLTRFNSVTSDAYIMLLKYMFDNVKMFDYFYASLPIAGIDGTLRDRMVGTEAEKNVHAKTGTLNSVSALTGYAISRDGEPIIFYIVMNGFGGKANSIRKKQDDFCEVLCQFSRK